MSTFFQILLAAHLICIGVWVLFQRGMILGWLGDIYERRLPLIINKPLFICLPCMASVHGTWIWFFFGGSVGLWVPFCLALCGLNKIVSNNFLRE